MVSAKTFVKQGAGNAANIAKSGAKAASNAASAAASAAKKGAKKGADVAASAAKKAAKAASDNASTLIKGGLAVGGALYLEDKFKDAKEDIKNCMKVCLPENWDDYKYGDLKKTDLKYRVLEGEDADPNQPLCTKSIEDCGNYCDDKCVELHEYEIPGSNLLDGATDAAGGAFKGFLDVLGLGGDGSIGKWVSGFCIFIILLIVFTKIF